MSNNQYNNHVNNAPPRASATDPDSAVYSAATAVAATSTNPWATYTGVDGVVGAPAGKVWMELEVTGFDAYVRFCRSALTGTTAANGAILKVGVPRLFCVEPNVKDKFLDHISPGGVGVIKWRIVGPIVERLRA